MYILKNDSSVILRMNNKNTNKIFTLFTEKWKHLLRQLKRNI